MKIAIVQFDNRPPEQLGGMLYLAQRNSIYAHRHGYEHHLIRQIHYDLPIYWQKPAICRRFFELGYDLVLWLDTDAVIHDLDRRLEDVFAGPETVFAAGDNPHWSSPFNAGVFCVKGAGGLDLLTRWTAAFPAERWTRTETAWICREEWAGPAFEQGAFVEQLLPELSARGQVKLMDWRVLQAPFPVEGAFTLHFPGPFRVNLVPYLTAIGADL